MNKEDIIIEQLVKIEATLETIMAIQALTADAERINQKNSKDNFKSFIEIRNSRVSALLSELFPEKFPVSGEKK